MFILGKTICFLLVKMKARLMLKEQKKLPNKLFIYLFILLKTRDLFFISLIFYYMLFI